MNTEDQQTAFDLAILGTGVTECAIAGAAAAAGKTVLHIDANAFYGARDTSFDFRSLLEWVLDCQASASGRHSGDTQDSVGAFRRGFDHFSSFVSGAIHSGAPEQMLLETEPQEISVSDLAIELADGMPELALSIEHLLSDSKNGQTEGVQGALKNRAHTLRSLLQRSRSFNIELYPRLVYANGACVELLLASGVNNYLEFKALENASVRWGGSIVNVPVSKEDISNNSAMSLIEKRTLMKTLKTIVELPKEGPGAPADDVPFSTYLQQQGLSRSIIQVFTDSVSCALELSSDVSTNEGVKGTRSYLKSAGRYGRTPFLVPAYGGGSEMAQGFSRLCAVHGGTYMLGQSVKTISIVDDAEYPVAIDLGTEGTAFKARKAVLNLDYADGMDIQTPERFVSRAIVVTDRPIQSESELDVVVWPSEDGSNTKTIVVQGSSSSQVAPVGLSVLHLFTPWRQDPVEDLRAVVAHFADLGRPGWGSAADLAKDRPTALFALFFRQRFRDIATVADERPLIVIPDTPTGLHFENLGSIVRDSLQRLFPDAALFPKPDPEEAMQETEKQETAEQQVAGGEEP